MLCPATLLLSHVKLTRVASPRHHPSWNSLPHHPAPVSATSERVKPRRACGLCRRRGQAAPGNYPAALAHALAQCGGASDVPSSRRGGRSVKSRRRARAGNPEAEWRGTAAQGVARPSVLAISEPFNTTTPERPRLLPSIVAPAAALPPFRVGG
ncbi:hypothetical protein VPH35_064389 [Triticum aestivum]